MIAHGIDALVASAPENLYYASHHWSVATTDSRGTVALGVVDHDGRVAALVVSCGEVASWVDAGYEPEQIWTFGRFFFEGGEAARAIQAAIARAAPTAADALARALEALKLDAGRVGIDEGQVPLAQWSRLAGLLPRAAIVPAQQIFKQARRVKGADEIACLERAAEITEDAFHAALATARAGITERELARRFETEVVSRGGRLSMALPVVTFGERAALSDTLPSGRPLRAGDVMRFDLLATFEGYRADIARTAVCGDVDPRYVAYYEAMRAGADAGMAALRPGVPVERIYEIAVGTAREHGVPHYRRQHVGHAIGLEVYDEFGIAPGVTIPLETDMVLCVETPYYEIGWGGVQIEDLVRVTPAGPVRLNKTPRDLVRISA
jgi:Xaa-Pro aminopeptidase